MALFVEFLFRARVSALSYGIDATRSIGPHSLPGVGERAGKPHSSSPLSRGTPPPSTNFHVRRIYPLGLFEDRLPTSKFVCIWAITTGEANTWSTGAGGVGALLRWAESRASSMAEKFSSPVRWPEMRGAALVPAGLEWLTKADEEEMVAASLPAERTLTLLVEPAAGVMISDQLSRVPLCPPLSLTINRQLPAALVPLSRLNDDSGR
jgi:hypothetical protein